MQRFNAGLNALCALGDLCANFDTMLVIANSVAVQKLRRFGELVVRSVLRSREARFVSEQMRVGDAEQRM